VSKYKYIEPVKNANWIPGYKCDQLDLERRIFELSDKLNQALHVVNDEKLQDEFIVQAEGNLVLNGTVTTYKLHAGDILSMSYWDKKQRKKRWENRTEECTCSADCLNICKGQCGCKSCHQDYQDFLSGE